MFSMSGVFFTLLTVSVTARCIFLNTHSIDCSFDQFTASHLTSLLRAVAQILDIVNILEKYMLRHVMLEVIPRQISRTCLR